MSDDIPIGSPPAPPGRHAAPSGWYPDPVDPARERYWDGWQWSRSTRPAAGGGPAHGTDAPGSGGFGHPSGPAPGPHQGAYPPGGASSHTGKATTTADGVPLAGWGSRAGAAIIDAIITTILSMIAGLPLLRRMGSRFSTLLAETYRAAQEGRAAPTVTADQLMSTQDQLFLGLIIVAVGLVYSALFWRWRGQTPGDMIVGIKVVHAQRGTDRTPLAWTQVVVRSILWVVPQFSLCFVLFVVLNCLFPLWQPNRQAIHDLAARTQVVRPPRGASPPTGPR